MISESSRSSSYFNFLRDTFPLLAANSTSLISENLLSPFTLHLPRAVLIQAQRIVRQIYQMREQPHYAMALRDSLPEIAHFDPGNKSICMSYDFHVTSDHQLKLIEVNTNAAFLVMGALLYPWKGDPPPVPEFDPRSFVENCLMESRLSGVEMTSVAIVDETPPEQRLYIEFLIYEQLFKKMGFEAQVHDLGALNWDGKFLWAGSQRVDFVYNRSTDFYFSTEKSKALRDAYSAKAATVSPNPHEYGLLADKQRLIEWTVGLANPPPHPTKKEVPLQDDLYALLLDLKPHFLETLALHPDHRDLLWKKRKQYFFKPMTSFGSKGTYRGSGISRLHYDSLYDSRSDQHFLAQEYCPPPQVTFETQGSGPITFKYDLRIYAYRGDVQMAIARLYQGQVTNMKTPLGGFATVVFDD